MATSSVTDFSIHLYKKNPELFNQHFQEGHARVLKRLLAQSKKTGTPLPAASYAEAIQGIRAIASIPHAMGDSQSARVKECVVPLFMDLYHLAFILAGEDDDPNGDTTAAIFPEGR